MMPSQVMTTEEVQLAWDRIATGYDEHITPFNLSTAAEVLPRYGVRPGMRFLDVGSGTGALSIPAARLGAEVAAVDISLKMIERLNARARAEGLSNLHGYVMDGHSLGLEDDTFDISASQNGVSLFPDLPRGLSELMRVTRPGGRVMIIAFGPPQKAEFLGFFLSALRAVVPGFTGLPMDPPPLPFQVADPEVLCQRMADAGLNDIQVKTDTWHIPFQSGKHFLDVISSSNPIGALLLADLTEEQRDEVRQVVDGMLLERSEGNRPAILNTEVNIAIGTK